MKTLVAAVDAATAENPSAKGAARTAGRSANTGYSTVQARGAAAANAGTRAGAAQPATAAAAGSAAGTAVESAVKTAAVKAAQAVFQAREAQQGLGRGTRRFGEAMWRPFVRLSGVVWLEVSGVFFGVFALLAAGYMWKFRGAWRASGANAGAHRSLMGAAAMLALFGYFCVSSFVRARRRERGR
jgi:hypothetical protein